MSFIEKLKNKKPKEKKFKYIETFIINQESLQINEKSSVVIPLKKSGKIKPKLKHRIKLEELFNFPFVLLHENRSLKVEFDDFLEEKEEINEMTYIVNKVQTRKHLYLEDELEKEGFLLKIFQMQFEKANIKNVTSACSIKPLNLYVKLMPNVLIFRFSIDF